MVCVQRAYINGVSRTILSVAAARFKQWHTSSTSARWQSSLEAYGPSTLLTTKQLTGCVRPAYAKERSATVGHMVTSAKTGHATILQIVLSVRLNQKRNISDQQHEFGVTASYNELRRSRISAAVAAHNKRRGQAWFESQTGLVQVIADNFDEQISWGRDVAFRTQGAVSDMYAIEAKYHVRNATSLPHSAPLCCTWLVTVSLNGIFPRRPTVRQWSDDLEQFSNSPLGPTRRRGRWWNKF